MATTTTNITIRPGRLSSHATALRGCINEVMSYARMGYKDDLEDAIRRMRINLTRLESEARFVVEEN